MNPLRGNNGSHRNCSNYDRSRWGDIYSGDVHFILPSLSLLRVKVNPENKKLFSDW